MVLPRQADVIPPPRSLSPFPILVRAPTGEVLPSATVHGGGCPSAPREHLLASTAPWLTLAFPFYTAATAPRRARPPEDAGRLQRDHAAT